MLSSYNWQLELITTLFVSTIFCSCISNTAPDYSEESKYISYVRKLPSPDGKLALYSYWVKYPKAKYGHSRFVVLPAKEKFKPSANFFAFEDTLYGFNIEGWSRDTIKSLCITPSEEPPQALLPYKRELAKVNNAFWVKDYYYSNSFGGGTDKYFDSIIYLNDEITFAGKDTSHGNVEIFRITAKKGQVTIPLGDSIILVSRLETFTTIDAKYNEGDSVRRPPLVSISSYQLRPKGKVDWKLLKDFGVFVEQFYKK